MSRLKQAIVASLVAGACLAAPEAHAQNPNVTALTFPNQTVGTPSAPLAVTVSSSCVPADGGCLFSSVSPTFAQGHTNGCPNVMGISDPSCVPSTEYTQTNNCPALTAATPPCTVLITFTPNAPGPRLATISLGRTVRSVQQSPSGGKVFLTGTGVVPATTNTKKQCKKKKGKKGARAAAKKKCAKKPKKK